MRVFNFGEAPDDLTIHLSHKMTPTEKGAIVAAVIASAAGVWGLTSNVADHDANLPRIAAAMKVDPSTIGTPPQFEMQQPAADAVSNNPMFKATANQALRAMLHGNEAEALRAVNIVAGLMAKSLSTEQQYRQQGTAEIKHDLAVGDTAQAYALAHQMAENPLAPPKVEGNPALPETVRKSRLKM